MQKMRKIGCCVSVIVLAALSAPGFAEERDLARAQVLHCVAAGVVAPAVVYLADGQEAPPPVEGEPPEVGCEMIDTGVDPASSEGSIVIQNSDGGAIQSVIIDATVFVKGRTYRFADWADAESHAGNGKLYRMVSRLREDALGVPIRYPMHFLRRTPDLCQESTGDVVACGDRTTMVSVQLAPEIWLTGDFRPVAQ